MRIAVKMTLMVLCSLIGGLALFSVSWIKYSELETKRQEHLEQQLALRDVQQLEAFLNQWLTNVDLFFSQRQQHLASDVGRQSLQLKALLRRLEPHAPTEAPVLTARLTAINQIVKDTAPQKPDNLALWNQRLNKTDQEVSYLTTQVDQLDALFKQSLQRSRSTLTLTEQNMLPTLASYTMAYVMITALLWLWMSQTLVRPLQRLQQQALKPLEEQGSESFTLHNGPHELQKLANSLYHTNHRLAETLKRSEALQQQHEQSLAQIESMMAATNDAVVMLDGKGNILDLNRATRDKFNLTTDAAGQTHINELIPNLAKNGSPMQPFAQEEHIGQCTDGHKLMLEITSEALDHSKGGFTLIMRDITPQKIQQLKVRKLNEKLVAASNQAAIAEVATGTLDTISKGLKAINNAVEQLKRNNENRNSQCRLTEVLEQHLHNPTQSVSTDGAVEQLTDHLEELSQLISLEQGEQQQQLAQLKKKLSHIGEVLETQQHLTKSEKKTESLDVAEVLDEALTIHRTKLDSLNIDVAREYQSTLVQADKHELMQILVNLIRNAIDAIAEHPPTAPQLRLRVQPLPNQRLGIDIIDNGVGLTAEQKQKLFRHGYTTKSSGQGLGLNRSAVAAKKMHGDIQAVSEGHGRGSLFRLQLPAARAAKKVA